MKRLEYETDVLAADRRRLLVQRVRSEPAIRTVPCSESQPGAGAVE